jgi:hypothetical protein
MVVGINPLTGRPKFTVQVGESQAVTGGGSYTTVGNLIIAGDGYAYLPYLTYNIITNTTGVNCVLVETTDIAQHFGLMRIGVGGDAYPITLGDWTATVAYQNNGDGFCDFAFYGTYVPSVGWTTPITNGGTGVLLSWEAVALDQSTKQYTHTFNLATTSGTAVASQTSMAIPAQATPAQPILQRSDGSYVGTVSIFPPQPGQPLQNLMIAFTSAGAPLWTVPNDSPEIATSDGGVVGASGTTYDQNGNATGQQVSSETISWTGNSYAGQSTVDQTSSLPADYADTFAAQAGNNPSQNGTHVKGRAYAQFKKCTSTDPNALCPHDSVLVALQALQTKLGANADQCPDCTKYIFSPLGATSEEVQFSKFIRRIPQFYDGTRSTVKLGQLCEQNLNSSTPDDAGYACFGDLGYGGSGPSVADTFQEHPNLQALAKYQPTNAHDPKGKKGLVVFFRPSAIRITSALSNSIGQIVNQSVIFHESLHEYYGFSDSSLQKFFGITVQDCTGNISDYITFNAYRLQVNSCQ